MRISEMPKLLGEMMFKIKNIKELELAEYFLMEAQSQINRYLERGETK